MTDQALLPIALLAIRCACHVMIFLRVATYTSHEGSHHRKIVGAVAALFAGLNLAEALRIVFNFQAFTASVEPYLPGIMVCVLIFVTWSGGNMASWFPKKLLDRLP